MPTETKHLSYRQLGAGLGISHVAARKLVLRGMPSHNLDEATEWRKRNTRTLSTLQRYQTRGERGTQGRLRPLDAATRSFDDWLDRDGRVESVQDAVHFFCFYLARFDQRLDTMPAELAHVLRLDAPDEAELVLMEWREALRAEMRDHLSRLSQKS
jgi:hypothetical protein